MANVKVAVVTGGNKGIGLAVVKQLCQQFDGCVYLTSRSEDLGLAAIAELKNLGLNPKYHQLDIEDIKSIEQLLNNLQKTHGGLDVLVNNAGFAYKGSSTVPFGEQAENTMNINFYGTHNVCKFLFPLLRPHARVINVSSIAGQLSYGVKGEQLKKEFKSDALDFEKLSQLMRKFVKEAKAGEHAKHGWGNSAYSVTKVGVTALSRIQQWELNKDPRTDIIVTAVEPGLVATDMSSHKGNLTTDEGADPIVYCALLPHNSDEFKGAYVSQKRKILKWE